MHDMFSYVHYEAITERRQLPHFLFIKLLSTQQLPQKRYSVDVTQACYIAKQLKVSVSICAFHLYKKELRTAGVRDMVANGRILIWHFTHHKLMLRRQIWVKISRAQRVNNKIQCFTFFYARFMLCKTDSQ